MTNRRTSETGGNSSPGLKTGDSLLALVETATSDQFKLANGASCSTRKQYVANALAGSFTATGFNGQYVSSAAVVPCNNGTEVVYDPYVGTWSGIL